MNPHNLDESSHHGNDSDSHPMHKYHCLLNDFVYIYPQGTAPQKVKEDKVEELHSSITMNLSDKTMIQPFYTELRCQLLQTQNIPLTDWNNLQIGSNILDIFLALCQNYESASVVMSRAICNLLKSNKESLIMDGYFQGELCTYSTACDGFGFLKFLVTQVHPNCR